MSWINTPNGRSILVLAAVMLASMVLVVGLQIADVHPVLPVRLALALIAVDRTPVDLSDAKPGALLFYGAGVMVLAQLVGFFVASAYWWARRR
jgi:hypothetical protein